MGCSWPEATTAREFGASSRRAAAAERPISSAMERSSRLPPEPVGRAGCKAFRAPFALFGRQVLGIFGRARRDGQAALDGGARAQFVEPAFEISEFFDVLPLRLPVHGPKIADHIGDGIFVAGDIAAIVETIVENAIEPVGLVSETKGHTGSLRPRKLAKAPNRDRSDTRNPL